MTICNSWLRAIEPGFPSFPSFPSFPGRGGDVRDGDGGGGDEGTGEGNGCTVFIGSDMSCARLVHVDLGLVKSGRTSSSLLRAGFGGLAGLAGLGGGLGGEGKKVKAKARQNGNGLWKETKRPPDSMRRRKGGGRGVGGHARAVFSAGHRGGNDTIRALG